MRTMDLGCELTVLCVFLFEAVVCSPSLPQSIVSLQTLQPIFSEGAWLSFYYPPQPHCVCAFETSWSPRTRLSEVWGAAARVAVAVAVAVAPPQNKSL
jgi:hypothetical protein